MRLAAAVLFPLALLALAVAAYANGPVWRVGLYLSALLFTWFGLALVAVALDAAWPAQSRPAWSGLALASEASAWLISRGGPLGSLPEQPLIELGRSGLSVAGLGLFAGGVGLAVLGVRSGSRVSALLGGLALLEALFAMAPWVARLS